ncbi:MAG: response regulator [Anaerocolumna sp.]
MIQMIVADDEAVIIKGIKKLIDWDSMGIEIVGEYLEGKTALEGIITLKPDIALLDINMPNVSGMDILKEIRQLHILTDVIFFSGFQEFSYAKDALTYGAVDYLLKPLIKEELVKSLNKSLSKRQDKNEKKMVFQEKEQSGIPYENLIEIEQTTYITSLFEILFHPSVDSYAKRLIRFSIFSFIEKYLEENKLGIVFEKNDNIVGVLKGTDKITAQRILEQLCNDIFLKTKHRVGVIVGNVADSMGAIGEEYSLCNLYRGYFYFEDQLKNLIIQVSEPVFSRETSQLEFNEAIKQLQHSLTLQEEGEFCKCFDKLKWLICKMSDGKKDDACFYFYNVLRAVEEWYIGMNFSGLKPDMKKVLEEGRNSYNYKEMTEVFKRYLLEYMQSLKSVVVNNDKKDIIKAIEYIEAHYRENLTLEVLAGIVHMNTSYFSTFFKKNANMNFKDYLNNIRLEHAISLLLSTDYKIYDIASRIGFKDVRSFNELFTKRYKETPASYRKRISRSE